MDETVMNTDGDDVFGNDLNNYMSNAVMTQRRRGTTNNTVGSKAPQTTSGEDSAKMMDMLKSIMQEQQEQRL